MKPVVIRNIKRADSNAVGTLAAVGVSTCLLYTSDAADE